MVAFSRPVLRRSGRSVAASRAAVVVASLGIAALTLLAGAGHAGAQTPLSHTVHVPGLGLRMNYPDGWAPAAPGAVNITSLVNADGMSQVSIFGQSRPSAADAVGMLSTIAAEATTPPTFLTIDGWPALQRRHVTRRSQPSSGPTYVEVMVLHVTTAVAAGSQLVRVDASLPSDADEALIGEVEAMGRSLVFAAAGHPAAAQQTVQTLTSRASQGGFTPVPMRSAVTGAPGPAAQAGAVEPSAVQVGTVQRVFIGGNGEIEVAASTTGQNIVIVRQNAYANSQNGGQTFPNTGGLGCGFGDSSVGFGQSGSFYTVCINRPAGCPDVNGNGCSLRVRRSIDNGATFVQTANDAVTCPNVAAGPPGPGDCFPDQPHLVADRTNAAAGGDQVYVVWRNFTAGGETPTVVCSQDNGANWTAPLAVGPLGSFVPRINVGQDGFVYVVYRTGGNVMLTKLSSCAAGFAVQAGFPVTVGPVIDVTCPVPGLDRCNDGNVLSSHMVAVDDTNPNHVYVVAASNIVAGHEGVFVVDSLDGGATFPAFAPAGVPRNVQISNPAVPTRRFMPWICTAGGDAWVTWYDRRASTPCATPPCAANNDLTDFYGGGAGLDGTGALTALPEFKITPPGGTDAQCASNWPCAPRATGDSESCSVQPQNAGICCTGFDANGNCIGSAARCDFAPDSCTAPETCRTGGGCPKYGDYNGNACAAGRLFASWASATLPSGVAVAPAAGPFQIDTFFAGLLVADVPLIQVPGGVTTNACLGATAQNTLSVCNTGTANLVVSNISCTDPQLVVTPPSSGFAVTISPDFCFPFQVAYSPTGSAPVAGTCTVFSNDPARPAVDVTVNGTSGQPQISVTGSTDFGTVCGDPNGQEKTLQVCNVAASCNLNVSSAVLLGPGGVGACNDFQLVNNPFPSPVSHDFCLGVTVKFTPTSVGPKTCVLRISSDDPTTPVKDVTLNGNAAAGTGAIDVPADQFFLPEVIQTVGVCESKKPFPISNTGQCPVVVTGLAIGGVDAADFKTSGLPGLPAALQPGHVLGEGNLNTVFAPNGPGLSRNRIGSITVTWENDPVLHTTTQITRNLCGEAVFTGARLLARYQGVPVAALKSYHLQAVDNSGRRPRLVTREKRNNLPLVSVTPSGVCQPFQYHREWGTVSNPVQLPPGSYRVTVTIQPPGLKAITKTVAFDLGTCDFNPNVIVDFP